MSSTLEKWFSIIKRADERASRVMKFLPNWSASPNSPPPTAGPLPSPVHPIGPSPIPKPIIPEPEVWSLKDANGKAGVFASGGGSSLGNSPASLELGGYGYDSTISLYSANSKLGAGESPFGQCQLALWSADSSINMYTSDYKPRFKIGLEQHTEVDSPLDYAARLRFILQDGTTATWIDNTGLSAYSISGVLLKLGGQGVNSAGAIVIRNEAGQQTAFLNGEDGSLQLAGDVILENADCAEDFYVDQDSPPSPGTVVILMDDGHVSEAKTPYDTRAAGIVSGAGAYKPGLVLDRRPDLPGLRVPVALMGKVFCKVDASYGSIRAGDLLTTSETAGHAMIVADHARSHGAILGKALKSLSSGCGVIPVLAALA